MENRILHVEDNPDDVMLVGMAFRKAGLAIQIDTAMDGQKAIEKLRNGSGSEPPACVLLDIKLPIKSGLEVLEWIRSQPHLKRLPIIMLTSSNQANDINRAYDLGANSYLVKPPELEQLIELAKTIDLYWLRTNARPLVVA